MKVMLCFFSFFLFLTEDVNIISLSLFRIFAKLPYNIFRNFGQTRKFSEITEIRLLMNYLMFRHKKFWPFKSEQYIFFSKKSKWSEQNKIKNSILHFNHIPIFYNSNNSTTN